MLTRSVRGYACRVIILASWLWRAVLGLLLLVAIAGTVRASDGSRIAFVVGNANYVEAVALKNPINDAAAMVSLFQRSGFMVEEINDLKTTEVATLRQKIEQIDRGSVVFFYYAGHGVQLDGRNYLWPVDVPTNRPDSMTDASLYLGDVLAAIEKRSPKLAVVILDACRGDPFGTKANDITMGLARVDPPASTVVFYTTRPGVVAADGEGANGLFTSALIQVATQETTPIEVLFRRVSKSVYEKSQGEQEPWVEGVIREEFALSKPVERVSSDPPNHGPGVAVAAAEPSAKPSEPLVIASESVTVTPNRTNFVTKAVAFKQLAGLAAAGRLDADKTYYMCDGDTCQPYQQWSVALKNSANVRSLKNETNFFDRVDSSRMCAWSFEEGRCEKDQVEFTIVNPLAMFNKGFFQGYDILEMTGSRSGGVNFRADTRAGSIWFGSKRNYVKCKHVDGRIEFLNRRTAFEIASARCMGVLPSATKTTMSVLMVDLDAGGMIVAYDFTMFAGLAGAASSGFAQITFGEGLK